MVHWWQCCTGRQVRGEGFSRYGRRAGVGAALGLVLVMVGGLRRRCSVDDDGDSCLVCKVVGKVASWKVATRSLHQMFQAGITRPWSWRAIWSEQRYACVGLVLAAG